MASAPARSSSRCRNTEYTAKLILTSRCPSSDPRRHHVGGVLGPTPLDAAIVNTAQPSPKVLKRYSQEGAEPVDPDIDAIEALGVRAVARPVASSRHLMRHDPEALADAIIECLAGQA